ncbi:MAG: PfkB family carbohydrate kinase [Chitinophagales bacterium]
MKKINFTVVTEPPIVDFIYEKVSADFAKKHQLKEWQLIESLKDLHFFKTELAKQNTSFMKKSGGQLTNTLYNLNILSKRKETPISSAILSVMATDNLGLEYKQELEKVDVNTDFVHSFESTTANCLSVSIATAELSKAMLTYWSDFKSLENIRLQRFTDLCLQTQYLFFEGYLFNSEPLLIEKFIAIAKKIQETDNPSLKIGITLSSDFVAKKINKNFVIEYVDIIASNDNELLSLMNMTNVEQAIATLNAKKNKTIVCTLGKKGAFICINDKSEYIASQLIDKKKIKDVTGAGDTFLAGFLYGLLNNKNILEMGHIAQEVATEIIQTKGARLVL